MQPMPGQPRALLNHKWVMREQSSQWSLAQLVNDEAEIQTQICLNPVSCHCLLDTRDRELWLSIHLSAVQNSNNILFLQFRTKQFELCDSFSETQGYYFLTFIPIDSEIYSPPHTIFSGNISTFQQPDLVIQPLQKNCHLFAKSLRGDILEAVGCSKLQVWLSWLMQEESFGKTE